VPLGTEEADELLADLSLEERVSSWHLVDDAGTRISAGAALAPALSHVRGGRIPAWVLNRTPRVTERGYRWVAAHRMLLGRFVSARMCRWASRVIESHGQAGT
jgi:predicted DCC family thiol-disulfide oxidoreductase YuxK